MDGPVYSFDIDSPFGVGLVRSDRIVTITPRPITKIIFSCKDGKTATLDLSTDVVTFTGDCSVDESAVLLGKALGILKRQEKQLESAPRSTP